MYHVQSTLPYLAAPNKIWAHSTRILLRFHSVNKYIHFFHLKAGGLLYGVADFVHDAFDNGGNVDAKMCIRDRSWIVRLMLDSTGLFLYAL